MSQRAFQDRQELEVVGITIMSAAAQPIDSHARPAFLLPVSNHLLLSVVLCCHDKGLEAGGASRGVVLSFNSSKFHRKMAHESWLKRFGPASRLRWGEALSSVRVLFLNET